MPCSKCHPKPVLGTPVVLYFDTENSPRRGYFYGKKHETRIQWVDKDWVFLMCSYAIGDGAVRVFQSWNEEAIVRKMWKLIDRADILVAHNATFDLGHFYAKCMKYGLGVPREPKRVCTLKMFRKLCPDGFESNSLRDIAVALGLPPKKELPREFWKDYIEKRSPKLVRIAKDYAGGDVVTLRAVHKTIEPYFPPVKLKRLKSDPPVVS